MKFKIYSTLATGLLVGSGLAGLAPSVNAVTLVTGSELQVAGAISVFGNFLDQSQILFAPRIPSPPPPTAAIGDYANADIPAGSNTLSFLGFDAPPNAATQIAVRSFAFDATPAVAGDFFSIDGVNFASSLPDFVLFPASDNNPPFAGPIPTNPFTLDLTSLSFTPIYQTLNTPPNTPPSLANPIVGFDIRGTGVFDVDGTLNPATLEFTLQGLVLTGDLATTDSNGSYSGTIRVVAGVPEPSSLLGLLTVGGVMATNLRKRNKLD